MKKALLLSAVLLFALTSFGDTIINNFTGYNDYWHPFGDPRGATQTYGEVFTAPDGIQNLSGFSFYMGNPIDSGTIITGAYIATWTGTHAGTLLYDSGEFDYDNAGNEKLTFTTGGLFVTPGQQYVMFLSTSKFNGDSFGTTFVPAGNTDPNLNGFAYFNNGNEFDALFTLPWDGSGLSPDWAVELQFDNAPEPGSLVLFGSGILSGLAILRRKLP
ncbi:MAG: PEP-CTERM sorting domain-containing protein [Candidatus Korobacteraceae bacterium]